jgi:DNA repair protein RadC
LGKELISKGGLAGTVANPKIIFHVALQHQASPLILVHNHPSGSLKPSHLDNNLTKNLVAAGKMLDINVFDHLIIADTGYFCFGDDGVL